LRFLQNNMPPHTLSDRKFRIIAGVLGALFFVKFAFFALFVTPLWEIPDEPGHYSYAESLSKGSYPVLGEAHMGNDVTRSWLGPAKKPPLNWIAQHPPLYYLLDAPVIAGARASGLDFDNQVRAARLPSALFGALAVVGLILFVASATDDKRVGIAAGIFAAATPMLLHLSSGVSHDTLVVFLASWSAYYLVRWTKSGDHGSLYACAALAGLCAVTKVTALAMAIPLFGAMTVRILLDRSAPNAGQRIMRVVRLWSVMFVAPLAWVVYNLIVFGGPLPDSSTLGPASKLVQIGFFQYMTSSPFWQHTLLNYVALIGWTGMEHGTLRWMQAEGYIAQVFVGTILFISMTAAALAIPHRTGLHVRSRWIMAALAVVATYMVLSHDTMHLATIACVMTFLALALTAVALLVQPRELFTTEFVALTSITCVLFFSFVYYHHLWSGYTGQLRATHGRYFYPVLPFVAYALARPFARRNVGILAIAASLACLLVSDTYFLRDISVFYGQL
jgi:4-amino-4-deoxy-L-arabinose transferase-like glycosyltransferase